MNRWGFPFRKQGRALCPFLPQSLSGPVTVFCISCGMNVMKVLEGGHVPHPMTWHSQAWPFLPTPRPPRGWSTAVVTCAGEEGECVWVAGWLSEQQETAPVRWRSGGARGQESWGSPHTYPSAPQAALTRHRLKVNRLRISRGQHELPSPGTRCHHGPCGTILLAGL